MTGDSRAKTPMMGFLVITAVPIPNITGAMRDAAPKPLDARASLGAAGVFSVGRDIWVIARGGRLKAAVPLRRGLPRTGASVAGGRSTRISTAPAWTTWPGSTRMGWVRR
jgi:hypothetical protein